MTNHSAPSRRTGDRRRVLFVQAGRENPWDVDYSYRELLPHIGLAYVVATVRAAGHETRVIDGHAEGLSLKRLVERVRAFDPEVVAFTANTTQINDAAAAAAAIRALLPGAFIVLGGYHVSPIPVETLRTFPMFDAAVFGEGEHSFVELLDALDDRDALAKIPGVCARRGDEVVAGPPRPGLVDLDSLPLPAYDLFPVERYYGAYTFFRHRSLNLSTARGCPYRCIFCQNPGGIKYRKRSMEAVMEEIAYNFSHYGTPLLYVTDETFTLDRNRAVEFCEGMLKRGLERRVRWFCETRVDAVDQELIGLIKRAGCVAMFYGVESGNQETLDRSKKRITKEESIAAIRWAREAGIFTHTNYIFGNPFETRETIHESIRFALEVDSDAAGFSIMVPYPGTEILRMAREGYGGLRLLSEDWRDHTKVVGGALELENIPLHELEGLQLYAYARFYLRPRKIANLQRVAHRSAIPISLARSVYHLVSGFLKRRESRAGIGQVDVSGS
jgi:anaerobic magnesium-protoporphyrin IX monomethyl ester cyclase